MEQFSLGNFHHKNISSTCLYKGYEFPAFAVYFQFCHSKGHEVYSSSLSVGAAYTSFSENTRGYVSEKGITITKFSPFTYPKEQRGVIITTSRNKLWLIIEVGIIIINYVLNYCKLGSVCCNLDLETDFQMGYYESHVQNERNDTNFLWPFVQVGCKFLDLHVNM